MHFVILFILCNHFKQFVTVVCNSYIALFAQFISKKHMYICTCTKIYLYKIYKFKIEKVLYKNIPIFQNNFAK